jgi:DNA-binding FadR family transcriptional regulator
VADGVQPGLIAYDPSTSSSVSAGRSKVRESLISRLVEAIVSGEIPENSTLPNEGELQTRYGVSRTALREAMQFLTAQGMVRARTRAGTTVLPSDEWNFLDPVVLDAALRRRANTGFYEALIEARALLEPEAAALAAERASARQLARIEQAFLAMAESNSRDDEAWSRADVAFHTAIIEASGNWIYRHFASAIRAALTVTFRLTHQHTTSHAEAVAMHHAVLEAIRLRKPKDAAAAMYTLTRLARKDLASVLESRELARPSPAPHRRKPAIRE